MKTLVLGESQGKNKVVILEKILGEPVNGYRLTVCTRYGSFDKGAEAFLSETPPQRKKHYTAQIEDARKLVFKKGNKDNNQAV